MHTTTVVIGAGHAGLAMSQRLTERAIDHVVLERGEVANSWRTERWDSLRLLTPNWQSRLPGSAYDGADPDGFMAVSDVIDMVDGYATAVGAPVRAHTTVTSLRPDASGYLVETDQGVWEAPSVVLASGSCNVATVPPAAAGVPPEVATFTPMTYRSPADLPDGGVLVVGASATGLQLAEEIHRSGRPVVLAVGEHVRLPRSYRGRDIFWWMERSGLLDERYDEVDDIVRARNVPSPQLVGTPERISLDLNTLSGHGVELVGRLGAVNDGVAQFSGSLANVCMLADLKMNRLLNTLDEWAEEAGVDGDVAAPERFEPTRVPPAPRLGASVTSGEIRSVLWATGYRPDYGWLDVDVLDRKGRIRHDGGVVSDAPGLYLLGATFLRRRGSSFIHGSVEDSRALADHLRSYLDGGLTRPG
jgi:putative flavoprotein involved in K+ transport